MSGLVKPYKDKHNNKVSWAMGVVNSSWIELPVVEEKHLPASLTRSEVDFWKANYITFNDKNYGPLDKPMDDVPFRSEGVPIFD